jgi:hypothetical protein
MAQPIILLIGDVRRAEFEIACRDLHGWGQIVHIPSIGSALERLADISPPPDLIVLAQAHPGQFSTESVTRVQSLAPLARFVALLGSWCEGEVRSGAPWPGVERVYWHQWRGRMELELLHMADRNAAVWALPPTATDEERLLAREVPALGSPGGSIVIATPQYDVYGWLADACRRRGCATCWIRPGDSAWVEGAAATLFDHNPFGETEAGELERIATLTQGAPTIALIDFPRVDDHRRAMQAGAAAVLSKPLLISDLYWQLDERMGQS